MMSDLNANTLDVSWLSSEADNEQRLTELVLKIKEILFKCEKADWPSEKSTGLCQLLSEALRNIQKIEGQRQFCDEMLSYIVQQHLGDDILWVLRAVLFNKCSLRGIQDCNTDQLFKSSIVLPRLSAPGLIIEGSSLDSISADFSLILEQIKQLLCQFESKYRSLNSSSGDASALFHQLSCLTESTLFSIFSKVA